MCLTLGKVVFREISIHKACSKNYFDSNYFCLTFHLIRPIVAVFSSISKKAQVNISYVIKTTFTEWSEKVAKSEVGAAMNTRFF